MTNKGKCAKIRNCVEASLQPHRKGLKYNHLNGESEIKGGKKMKAIIETGGKQYYVEEGSVIYVEKLDVEAGKKVVFDKVLMINDVPGHPYLSNVTVEGEVIKHGKDKKIKVFKYNPKKKYRKTQGHRQPYTKVEIKKIIEK